MKTKEELETEYALLKAKHKTIWTLDVSLDEDADGNDIEPRTYFLRKIDRIVYSAAMSFISKDKTLDAVETVLRNLSIGGDDIAELLKSDSAIIALQNPIIKVLVGSKEAKLKKN